MRNRAGDFEMMRLATTPLSQLPLVSLDLETTGLQPARDRIVQIGAVTI